MAIRISEYAAHSDTKVNPITGLFMGDDDDLSLDELWECHERGWIIGDDEDLDAERRRYLANRHRVQRANAHHVVRHLAAQGRTCIWCAQPITPPGKRGRVPDYCSNACKQAAYRSHHRAAEAQEITP